MYPEINLEVAKRCLAVVDKGLSSGIGKRRPGRMCVEAAICYALGLPHGDDPLCVSSALRSLKISLNDRQWSSNMARANGLRRLAIAQLGSAGVLDDREFAKRVAEMAIRKMVPIALRATASIQKNADHRQKLLDAAHHCEAEGTRASALKAHAAAFAAAATNAAAYAAAATAAAAAYANAANAAANAAAATAAATATATAAKTARDKVLAEFAEEVVQILIQMKAPGCQWLSLTDN